jgi:hypothetical protein
LAPAALDLSGQDDLARRSNPTVQRDARIISPSHGSERRVHRRLSSEDLKGLREARMEHGPAVRLIDVSNGGALFETRAHVSPNAYVDLHLVGCNLDTVVPSRVLRSHVLPLGHTPWYRTACEFRQSIDVSVLVAAASQPQDFPTDDYLKVEFALKRIVEQYVRGEMQDGGFQAAGDGAAMLEALRMLQRSAERSGDPGDRSLAGLVARALRGLEGADSIGAAIVALEEHLRQVMPLAAIRVTAAPTGSAAGSDSIYFDISAHRRASACVLNVEFGCGFAPDGHQFRLLKSCAYLITLLRGFRMRFGGLSPAAGAATDVTREVPRTNDLMSGEHHL